MSLVMLGIQGAPVGGLKGIQLTGLTFASRPNILAYTLRGSLLDGAPEVKSSSDGISAKYFVLKVTALAV